MLSYYELGIDILGHKTNRVEWAYIALEHSLEETYRACQRVGVLDIIQHRLFGAIEDNIPDVPNLNNALIRTRQRFPDVHLIVLDGVAGMVNDGNINDFGSIKDMLRDIKTACQQKDLTVIGIGLDAKSSNPSQWVPYRQRPSGSGAWGQYSSTIFIMERENPRDIFDKGRRLVIEPRNAGSEQHKFVLDADGKLQNAEDQDADFLLDSQLAHWPSGTIVLTAEIILIGTRNALAKRSVERWITNCVEAKRLIKVSRGKYKVA